MFYTTLKYSLLKFPLFSVSLGIVSLVAVALVAVALVTVSLEAVSLEAVVGVVEVVVEFVVVEGVALGPVDFVTVALAIYPFLDNLMDYYYHKLSIDNDICLSLVASLKTPRREKQENIKSIFTKK